MDPLDAAMERQRAKNKPIDITPMKLIQTLISTQQGWIIRQALKLTAAGGVALTTWMAGKGLHLDNPEALTAGLSTVAVAVVEMALSKAASSIAAK